MWDGKFSLQNVSVKFLKKLIRGAPKHFIAPLVS